MSSYFLEHYQDGNRNSVRMCFLFIVKSILYVFALSFSFTALFNVSVTSRFCNFSVQGYLYKLVKLPLQFYSCLPLYGEILFTKNGVKTKHLAPFVFTPFLKHRFILLYLIRSPSLSQSSLFLCLHCTLVSITGLPLLYNRQSDKC